MYKIHYTSINKEVISDKKENSILDISLSNQIPHLHECGGQGNCTTCRVRILDGVKNISKRSQKEKRLAEKRQWDPSIRLACQCKVKGNISIQRLIWSMAEANKYQKELVAEDRPVEREVAILFCDLRDFTKLSAKNLTFDIAHMLNRFYTILGEPILMNNGIIYQYIGDEIVGVFGTAGGSKSKNNEDAVRAAIGMRHAVDRLNQVEMKDFDVTLQIGIGINFGKAFIGHLGHPQNRQFSVIGDTVNEASRIESNTKEIGTDILMSETVLNNLPEGLLNLGNTFEQMLPGLSKKTVMIEIKDFANMDLQLQLQSSLNILLKDEDAFAKLFYKKVFEKSSEVRALFTNDMLTQGRLLTHMLSGIVYSLSRPEYLIPGLQKLGENHFSYGVRKAHYPIVLEAMIETIEEVLADDYTSQTGDAWKEAIQFVTSKMKQGSDKSNQK